MNHQSTIINIVGLLLAYLLLIDCGRFARADLSSWKNYEKINNYLAGKGTCDAAEYLGFAKEKLKTYDGNPLKTMLSQYVKDLGRLVKLEQVLASPSCEFKEYKNLLKVSEFAGGHEFVENPSQLSPVKKIVHSASLKRAQECRAKHLIRFERAYEQFDFATRERAEFTRDLLRKPAYMSNRDYVKQVEMYNALNEEAKERNVQISVDQLRERSPFDSLDGCNFNEMFEKYLQAPCARYERMLGEPILNQAYFDNLMFGSGEEYSDREVSLYFALANLKVCKSLDFDYRKRACRNWLDKKPSNCAFVHICIH